MGLAVSNSELDDSTDLTKMERKLLYPSVIVVGVSLVLIAFTITPIFFKLPPIPILGAASSFILQDEENRTVILNNYSNTVIFIGLSTQSVWILSGVL